MMHVRNPLYRSLRVFLIVALLSSVLAVFGPGAAAVVTSVNIVTPDEGAPVCKKPGQSFTVTYTADGNESAIVKFYLVNGGTTLIGTKSVSLPVTNDTYDATIPAGQADGIYDLKVEVVGTSTKSDVELNAVYVDGTAPGVTISNVDAWESSLDPIRGTSSDATSGVLNVEVSIQQASDSKYWDGTDWDSAVAVWNATGGTTASWTYDEPSTGWVHGETYTVCARATDKAGNVATPVCDIFTYDNTKPIANITTPLVAAWQNSLPSLAGNATDTGSGLVADSVEVQVKNMTGPRYWNGSIWTVTPSWEDAAWVPDSWTYIMPTLTSGRQYSVTVKAADVAGNFTTTTSSLFRYDDVDPTVKFTTPNPDREYVPSMTQFTGTALDGHSDVAKVEVKLQRMGVANTWWSGTTWVVTTTVPLLPTTGLPTWTTSGSLTGAFVEGVKYEVSAKATDNAGNAPWVSHQFTIDNTAPAVTLDAIADTVGCDFAQISGTSSDATSGVITVTVQISNVATSYYWQGGSTWLHATPKWVPATGTTAWTVDLTGANFADGQRYNVRARAEDNAANLTAAPKTDSFVFDDCPTVELVTPVHNANLKDLDEITGTAGAGVGAIVEVKVQIQKGLTSEYWNGTGWGVADEWVPAVDTAGGTFATWKYDTSGIAFSPDENYIVRAKSKDDRGHWSAVDAHSFKIDTTAPSVTINNIPDPSQPTQFTGTASDGLTGVYTVSVTIKRVSSGPTTEYWSGTAWVTGEVWVPVSTTLEAYVPHWTWNYPKGDLFVDNTPGDVYTVCARAEDRVANVTAVADQPCRTFTYAPGDPAHAIALGGGWNLISLPLIPADPTIEVVLADQIAAGTVDWVDSFFWVGGALVEKKWDPPILELTTMTTGQGYWVSMFAAGTLGNSGSYLPAPPQVPSSYNVYAGWNLIGYHATTATALDPDTATTVNLYLGAAVYADVQAMYYYDGGAYKAVLTGEKMKPGFGYWMALDAAGTIYP